MTKKISQELIEAAEGWVSQARCNVTHCFEEHHPIKVVFDSLQEECDKQADQAKAAFIELAESIDKDNEQIQQALIDEQAEHYQCEQKLVETRIQLETKDIIENKLYQQHKLMKEFRDLFWEFVNCHHTATVCADAEERKIYYGVRNKINKLDKQLFGGEQ
jgi:hypothetical protein